MTRAVNMLRNWRALIAVVAALAVTSVALAESGTLTIPLLPGPNPGTLGHVTITAGILFSTTNSRDLNPVLVAEGMLPGETRTGTVTIRNTGLLAGNYQLAGYGLTDHPGSGGGALSSVLHLSVDEQRGAATRRIYDGTLAGLNNTGIQLGRFNGLGETRAYTFKATLPSSTTTAYMGSASSIAFAWTGVSVP
jgi:hypothetical protein